MKHMGKRLMHDTNLMGSEVDLHRGLSSGLKFRKTEQKREVQRHIRYSCHSGHYAGRCLPFYPTTIGKSLVGLADKGMGAGGGRSHRCCPLLVSSVLSTHLSELSHFRFTMIEDNKENKDYSSERGRVTLIFSLKNEVGGLIKALKIFQVWLFYKAHLKMGLRNSIKM